MGLFSNIFGGSSSSEDDDGSDGSATTVTCDSCGTEKDESEIEWGQCEQCRSEYSGTTYCCGQIYEEGEDTCMSCGESL